MTERPPDKVGEGPKGKQAQSTFDVTMKSSRHHLLSLNLILQMTLADLWWTLFYVLKFKEA